MPGVWHVSNVVTDGAPEIRENEPHPITTDSVLDGKVRFVQPARGYRVNVDSILLAAFAASGGRRAALAVDLGSGVGLVGLLVAHEHLAREVLFVEQDPALAALAEQNRQAAGVSGRVLALDVAALATSSEWRQRAELVISNPPFFDPREHRAPLDAERRSARLGAIDPFLRTSSVLLTGSKARAVFAYPAQRLAALFDAAARVKLVPRRLRLVHSFPERAARLALVELRLARPGALEIEPPLIEWRSPGEPTEELSRISAGRANDRR
jgi:tRNA1Val (adenine37-N6)-methyltransferase